MKSQRIALRVAAVLFGLVCLGHVWRLIAQTEVQVGGFALPMWPSIVVVIATALLSIWMWRLASRGGRE